MSRGTSREGAGHRCRRHARQDPRQRADPGSASSLSGPALTARADGRRREETRARLEVRSRVDRLSGARVAQPAGRRAAQSGPGLGRLRLREGVRLPGANHQRRGDAGARQLPAAARCCSSGLGTGLGIDADRRRRRRADGTRRTCPTRRRPTRITSAQRASREVRQEEVAQARRRRGRAAWSPRSSPTTSCWAAATRAS